MRGIRVVVAAGLAGLLAGGLLVGPASAAPLPDVTKLPAKVTLVYKGAAELGVVKVALPYGGITCAVSSTDGWTTRIVGKAFKATNGAKTAPVVISGPTCDATASVVSWTVTAQDLSLMKQPRANAVVKFISVKEGVQTVQTLVVKVLPATGKVTGKR